jgi:hypothetical protein
VTVWVLAFVEGPTEEKFVREIIAPELAGRGVFITATTPGRKRFHGGVQHWARIRKELLRYLKEDKNRYVTTMFDYYGMPTDWPGRDFDRGAASGQKATAVEGAMLDDIAAGMGKAFNRPRFIPYIQMYEFEALLFSNTDILGKVVPEQDVTRHLQEIAKGFKTPEEIDDNPNTAPSKRIRKLIERYQKVPDGILAAQRTGLSLMRQKCPHFAEWLTKLESLQQENER